MPTARFRDRRHAGEELARTLAPRGYISPVVLGIPRGGVVVAAPIAAALRCPLGVAVARKIGAPRQPELALGAVTADGTRWLNEELAVAAGADEAYLAAETKRQVDEARRREAAFGARAMDTAGRTAILVDDGLATGATARAALRALRASHALAVVLVVPVGPPEAVAAMWQEADEVVCLWQPAQFIATGQFYDEFGAIEDEAVRTLLERQGMGGNAAVW